MSEPLILSKNSLGVGDRFAHQAAAQLRACMLADKNGVTVVPVWNKSNREHNIIGSEPSSVRAAADKSVRDLGWKHPYHVDADHINFDTVDRFLEGSDFYTIDVADWIAKPADSRGDRCFRQTPPGVARRSCDSRNSKAAARLTRIFWNGPLGSISLPSRKQGESTARSKNAKARDSLFRKFPWMRPTARKRPPNCSLFW